MRLSHRVLLLIGLMIISSLAFATNTSRTVTFNNYCSFDVWMNSVGSNASNIPCSPSSTDAKSDCPTGNVCYSKNVNSHYCVPGTSSTAPVSKQSDVSLNASVCPSGNVVTDTGSTLWGQCTCNADTDCASGQTCQTVSTGIKQCYWQYNLPKSGKIAKAIGNLKLDIPVNSSDPNALIASGKFYAKLGCDENGNCQSDNTKGAPASLLEFTFKNDNDWYDVSYINGINVPMSMYPVDDISNNYDASNPYRCRAAGADSCSATKACTKTGQVCGQTLKTVMDRKTTLQCGYRLGYWTYAQFCAAPSTVKDASGYINADLGVDCNNQTNYAYALCKNQAGMTDTGPGRSCFNSNTTSSGQTCCGYESWKVGGKTQLMAKGDSAVAGAVTTTWTTEILPNLKNVKEGCPLAYSFQFDDPYSTFTCATTNALNKVNYQIDLCQSINIAGISPPAVTACTPATPSGMEDDLTISIGNDASHNLAIHQCNAAGTACTTAVTSPATNIYAAASGTNIYQVDASNKETGVKQSCQFSIPQTGCIARVTSSADCKTWSIATEGAWKGRAIQIPAF